MRESEPEIDAIVDAIIERGSPTLDRIIAERDELRKELTQERALVRSWIEKAEATRAETERLTRERDELRAKWQAAEADALEWARKADELRGELERLSQHYQTLMTESDAKDSEIQQLRTALGLVKDWHAIGELTDPKMTQIQQALGKHRANPATILASDFPEHEHEWAKKGGVPQFCLACGLEYSNGA